MSVVLNINEIDKELQKKIVNDLVWKKSEYNPYTTTTSNVESEPLLGFKRINNDVYIPLAYASTVLGIKEPNFNRNSPQINIKYIGQLRESQKPLVEDALDYLEKTQAVQFAIHTGGGKTRMSCRMSCETNEIIAVIVTRGNIGSQWKDVYLEDTNLLESEIAMFGSKFPKYKGRITSVKLIIAVYSSISNIPKELLDRVGTLILDEAHSLCTPSAISGILDIHPKYVIIATATPSGGLYQVMEAIGGKNYVRKRIDETKEKTVYKLETGLKVPMRKNFQGTVDWQFTRDFILENKSRNELIVSQVLLNLHRKILILTFSQKHILTLKDMISKYNVRVSTFYRDQTTYSNADVLIGTYGKIKEGFDEENTCPDFDGIKIDIVIIACPVRKREHLEQSVGRSRADIVTILHLIDDHPTCHSQWNKDNRIVYKNLKIKIKEENISDMTLNDVLAGNYDKQIPIIYEKVKTENKLWKECIKDNQN